MGGREVVPGQYSVTEILKPPRIVNYSRQVGTCPNPFDLMFMSLGTAFHSIVEENGEMAPGHLFERQLAFRAPIDIDGREIILTGQPDQYDENTDTLTDYKTAGYYSVKLLMAGDWSGSTYRDQVNLYRRFRFPKCKRQQLVMLIKDYSRKLKHEGIPPLVRIAVPVTPDNEVDTDIKVRLWDILAGETDWAKSRDCTDEERWLNKKTGEFVRCVDYCQVRDECPQFQEGK